MPSLEWLKTRFSYGFDSGDIEAKGPDKRRDQDETISGGSYREVLVKGIRPCITPGSVVMELGPGRGSWTRAILETHPDITVHAIDFVDVTPWLNQEDYPGRLFIHRVEDNSFDCIEDGTIDFFLSFGVLCHNPDQRRRLILKNAYPKMKPGGLSIHQYGAWDKLDTYGWERGCVPEDFRDKPDEDIWWPRNSVEMMSRAAVSGGWEVVRPDMDLLKRDGLILLKK